MARFDNGWFKFYRRAFFEDIGCNVTCLALWTWLLGSANWKETKIIWRGKQRVLPPGSVVFGMKELSDKWGCSRSVILKWAKYLHDTGRIVLESCERGSVVTICNWEIYQSLENEACELRDSSVGTAYELRDSCEPLIEEGKKERKKKVSTAYTPEFEALWEKMPEGIKQTAFRAFQKHVIASEYPDFQKALENYKAAAKIKNQFQMHFSSFVGSDRTQHPWVEFIDRKVSDAPAQGNIDWSKFK